MTVRPGDIAPDFEQDTFNGSIRFHEWIGSSWCILFSTIDLAGANRLKSECSRRGVKLVGLSAGLPELEQDLDLAFPVIVDSDRSVSGLYGTTSPGAVYLIDPDKRIRWAHIQSAARCDLHEPLQWLDDLWRADPPQTLNAR